VLAELDTPFAKANFRALQKWWFKAPFYVFMAWLCFDASLSRGTVWFPLELASFVALQTMGAMALVLNVCLREVLERSGALGKRRSKKSASSSSRRLRRGASGINSSSRGSGTDDDRADRRPPQPTPKAISTRTETATAPAGALPRWCPREPCPGPAACSRRRKASTAAVAPSDLAAAVAGRGLTARGRTVAGVVMVSGERFRAKSSGGWTVGGAAVMERARPSAAAVGERG
ncbi:unnamed protein product, partial [Ectocarpus sp. 8 AP-2014]